MRLLVRPALLLLRIIAALMFAGAAGALAATGAIMVSGFERPGWLRAVTTFVLTLGLAVAAGAIGMRFLMPSTAELTGRAPGEPRQSLPFPITAVLAALAVIAAWQAPSIVSWWNGNLSMLREIVGVRYDPSGWSVFPAALLFVTPVLASLAVIAFVLSSTLALSAPPALAARVLAACLMLQGGLVGALYAIERGLRNTRGPIERFVRSEGDATLTAQVVEWLDRYDRAVGAAAMPLAGLCAGYLLAFALAWMMTSGRPAPSHPTARV